MLYILIPLSLAVVGTLAWAWWQDRAGRDPVNSIDSFHRALTAMQPGASHDVNGDDHRVIDLDVAARDDGPDDGHDDVRGDVRGEDHRSPDVPEDRDDPADQAADRAAGDGSARERAARP